jgi:hypothetical protein
MEKAMTPRNRPKNTVAVAAALALTFLVAGCVDHDGRYDSHYDNRHDQRYSGGRHLTRNAPDGYYINKGTPYEKRYNSYEHYADEMRNRRHKEQTQSAWDR